MKETAQKDKKVVLFGKSLIVLSVHLRYADSNGIHPEKCIKTISKMQGKTAVHTREKANGRTAAKKHNRRIKLMGKAGGMSFLWGC